MCFESARFHTDHLSIYKQFYQPLWFVIRFSFNLVQYLVQYVPISKG